MSTLILQPTVMAQWQTLVKEAEDSSQLSLSEDLESYLVFLLVRFTGKSEFAKGALALDFLQSVHSHGQKKYEELRDIGDKCLLISGLFPGRAQCRRVRISYFVQLGQSAYTVLSSLSREKVADLYRSLGEDFVSLMDILQVIREQTNDSTGLTPLQAEELWTDTASPHALKVLQRYTKAISIPVKGNHLKRH